MMSRDYTFIDRLLIAFDTGLRTLCNQPVSTAPNPATPIEEGVLSTAEQHHSAGLMRVNHVGEVCAQALYQGHALTARQAATREAMAEAALEEVDHLAWCQERLDELNSHSSYLNPLWYVSSFTLGVVSGLAGDRWSLGFVAETEHQVVTHLSSHLQKLPASDDKSRAIVQQMCIDEARHASTAEHHGAAQLPESVRWGMRMMSKVMTTAAYRI